MAFTLTFLFYRNTEEEKRTFIPLIDYILNVVCKSSLKILEEKQSGQQSFCIFSRRQYLDLKYLCILNYIAFF